MTPSIIDPHETGFPLTSAILSALLFWNAMPLTLRVGIVASTGNTVFVGGGIIFGFSNVREISFLTDFFSIITAAGAAAVLCLFMFEASLDGFVRAGAITISAGSVSVCMAGGGSWGEILFGVGTGSDLLIARGARASCKRKKATVTPAPKTIRNNNVNVNGEDLL